MCIPSKPGGGALLQHVDTERQALYSPSSMEEHERKLILGGKDHSQLASQTNKVVGPLGPVGYGLLVLLLKYEVNSQVAAH